MNAFPGDLLLVHRRRTWRSALAGPVGAFISWQIQRTTRSRWNHVAIVDSSGDDVVPMIIEAEWTGVRSSSAHGYLGSHHEIRVIPCPVGLDRTRVVEFARSQLRAKYDRKAILAMQVAALLWGADGIRRIVQDRDSVWICSELAAAAWRAGGWLGDALYPGEFERVGLSGRWV